MLNWLINRQLDSLERRLGASVDYLRHVAQTSKVAFFKFMGFVPLAAHRGITSREQLFVARFLATRHEDCGTCVQIVVSQAIQDRVSQSVISAMIAGNDAPLSPDSRLVAVFTRAVLSDSAEQDRLRAEVRTVIGEPALVDISLAIAAARVFPTLKRSLGYAVSCQMSPVYFPHDAGAGAS